MFPTLRYWLVAVQALFVLSLAAISARPIPFEYSRPMGAALMIWSVGFMFLIGRTLIFEIRADRPVTSFIIGIKGEAGTL